MAGAFAMTGFKSNLAWITPEEWEQLHKLPTKPSIRDEALWPIKNTSRFKLKRIVRTDANGQFEMRFQRSDMIHEFVVFEEDYLTAVLSRSDFGRVANGCLELPKMPLYPAAKIMIEPHVDCINVWLRFIPESQYGRKGPRYAVKVEGNIKQPCYIPAGHSYRAEFSIPYEDEWCIPKIPQTVNLKQGETLDLGRFVFEPAIKIFIKVVDSAGEPVVGVRLAKLSDDPYKMYGIHRTDENGICPYYVEPNSEPRFNAFQHEDLRLLKSVTLKIGGREDEGKEFTIQL
jgi:hypothetical protein